MAWHDILGHDDNREKFQHAYQLGKLPSTFLFVGPAGIGKRSFALELARSLHCSDRPERKLQACGICPSCKQVTAGTHPDILQVGLLKSNRVIRLEQLVGDRDHRMREGFCFEMSLKPAMSRWRIGIIDEAGRMGKREVQNSILKTLEEPPPYGLIILLAENEQQMIPTIRSRCQLVRFQPLTTDQVQQVLIEKDLVTDHQRAALLAGLSEGSLGRALAMNEEELLQFRRDFLGLLGSPATPLLEKVERVTSYVDSAGKEASARRERLQDAIRIAIDFYRQRMRASAGSPLQIDPELSGAVESSHGEARGGVDGLVETIEACLEAEQDVHRNVNVSNLIPAWLAELHKV